MGPIRGIAVCALLASLASAACEPAKTPAAARAESPRAASTPAPPAHERRSIPVREAVATLQRHVDVPVVLPRAGLRYRRGWRADPKYLEWHDGAGSMKLHKGEQILFLSYGRAGFDGCGDRTRAVETNVLGRPALVSQTREALWSHVLWPVTPRGSTGRYGLAGTFTAWQIVRLAESMETARLEPRDHARGC